LVDETIGNNYTLSIRIY